MEGRPVLHQAASCRHRLSDRRRPTDYENPGTQGIMKPGMETTENFSLTTGNTQDVYYYWRQ
jgi:hypothetical protein